MNVDLYVIKDYENKTAFRLQKNKPNSNPISAESSLNLSINITDNTSCSLAAPCLVSGTGYSYLGQPKMEDNLFTSPKGLNQESRVGVRKPNLECPPCRGHSPRCVATGVATGRIERGCALLRMMVLWTLNAQLRTLVPHWREPRQSE